MTAFVLEWRLLLLPLAALAAGQLAARYDRHPRSPRPALPRWLLPALAAATSIAATVVVWGWHTPIAAYHDESAYLLQAEMLLRGHLVLPARPLPEFFEQFHVYVTPVTAPRYPPGWAIALAPGVAVGLPALVPLLLVGATAVMLVLWVRRIHSEGAAWLAWLLWLVAPGAMRFRATYLSEHLSTFLWLFGWWALAEWRRTRHTGWLVALSLAGAWGGITRPLTCLVFTIPVAVIVLRDVWRSRAWRPLVLAVGIGLVPCTLVPLQNQQVTGHWSRLPLGHYSTVYFPFDLPGFGLDTRRPERPLPEDFKAFGRYFRRYHAEHVPERIPALLAARVQGILSDVTPAGGTLAFALLVVLGLVGAGAEMTVAAATALLLVLSYLTFAHPPDWRVYYVELHPILAAAAAIGLARVARALKRGTNTSDGVALALLVAAVVTLAPWPERLRMERAQRVAEVAQRTAFAAHLAALPAPAIVFIRYAPRHLVHHSLIENPADLSTAPVWRVYDRGAENAELLRLAPERQGWLYVESEDRFIPLSRDGVTPADARSAASPTSGTPAPSAPGPTR